MDTNFISIDIEADINQVIKIFEENQVWNIAVTENGKYKGFVSKSNLFNRYISLWHKQRSEEI
jgi:predicted transcriptional regulator